MCTFVLNVLLEPGCQDPFPSSTNHNHQRWRRILEESESTSRETLKSISIQAGLFLIHYTCTFRAQRFIDYLIEWTTDVSWYNAGNPYITSCLISSISTLLLSMSFTFFSLFPSKSQLTFFSVFSQVVTCNVSLIRSHKRREWHVKSWDRTTQGYRRNMNTQQRGSLKYSWTEKQLQL